MTVPPIRSTSGIDRINASGSIAKPAGTVAGDGMLMLIINYWSNSSHDAIAQGWTQLNAVDPNSGSLSEYGMFYRTAGSSEPSSYSLTMTGGSGQMADVAIVTFVGAVDFTPTIPSGVVNSGAASSVLIALPSITTATADNLILAFYGASDLNPAGAFTAAPGMTHLITNAFISIATMSKAVAGATGTLTASHATATPSIGIIAAIRPVAAPATAPGAPTIGAATAGIGSASVTFTAPASDGGSAITGYIATASTGETQSGASSPIVFAGMSAGVARTIHVQAVNSVGSSAASAESNSVTPTAATAPGAPTIGSATAGNTTASVTFTAPASNGGSAITSYLATASTGETQSGTSSPIAFPSLTNGVARTIHVQAINAIGTGTASAESNSVTPTSANTVPTFPGPNIANVTGTGGAGITSVDVHTKFADTDALLYSASPAGTAWPAGAVINSSTGIISGTMATGTSAGCKVRATDTIGQTVDSNAFSFIISAPATLPHIAFPVAGKNINGGKRTGIACRVTLYDMASDSPICTKTGLVTDPTTGLVSYDQAGPVRGVQYWAKVTSDADNTDLGIVLVTPT